MSEDGHGTAHRRNVPRVRVPRRLRGLRVQIVLWTVLPLTLVLIGVAFTGVYSHEQAMRDLVAERDQALAAVSAGQVRDLLRERADALKALAAEQAFHHQDLEAQQAALAEAGDLNGLFADGAVLVDEAGSRAGRRLGPRRSGLQDEHLADLVRAMMVAPGCVAGPAP